MLVCLWGMIAIFILVIAFCYSYHMVRSFMGIMVLDSDKYYLKGYPRVEDINFLKGKSIWIEEQEYDILNILLTDEVVIGEDGAVYQAIMIECDWNFKIKSNYKSVIATYRTEKKTWMQRYFKW